VIAGFAEALIDGTATGDDIGRAAQAIRHEAVRLEHLVGELGAVERLQSGDAGLRPEPINAAEALRHAAERFRPQANAEGIAIEVSDGSGGATTGASAPIVVTADRVAVDRMLANLTANALAAFGHIPPSTGGATTAIDAAAPGNAAPDPDGVAAPNGAALPGTDGADVRGHIWLSARWLASTVLADGAVGPATVLEVTDDGPGFPPGTTDRIFERFYRADAARAGGGSGLGLAIVRDLARAHGGEAIAQNIAPHGARVSVVLPTLPAASASVTAPPR
jgi:signal transduction histidine kinase